MTRRDVVVLGSTGSIGTQALDVVPRQPRPVPGRRADRRREQPRAVRAAGRRVVAGLRGCSRAGRGRLVRGRRAGLRRRPQRHHRRRRARARPWPRSTPATRSPWPTRSRSSSAARWSLEPREARPDRAGRLRALAPWPSACAAAPPRRYAASCSPRAAARSAAGPAAELADVTVEEALAHPTWAMGPVVTINSATLVNKGLEVIEAHLLFGIPFDRIEVVVHPTSVVHSMVEFVDGSTLVQASPPTMLIPIALGLALARPGPRHRTRRSTGPAPETWEFFPLDDEAFPAVSLARRAGAAGGTAPAVYNAANEVCRRGLPGRAAGVHARSCPRSPPCLRAHDVPSGEQLTVDDVLAADAWARDEADPPRRSTGRSIERRHEQVSAVYYTLGRGRLRRGHPGLDRPARARPHDPGQGVRREGHPVLHRLRPDRVEPASAARPSTASRRSRSAATSRSSGCCRRPSTASPTR